MYNFRIQDAIANSPAKTLTGRLIAPNAPTPTAQSITEDICETVRKFYYNHESIWYERAMRDHSFSLDRLLNDIAAEIENGVCYPEDNSNAPTVELMIDDWGIVHNTEVRDIDRRPDSCRGDRPRVYFYMDPDYYVCSEEPEKID